MWHLVMRSLLLTPVLALSALAPGTMLPAFGQQCGVLGPACGEGIRPCSCGDTVVVNTALKTSDPILQTPCPRDGLFVNSGVTLRIGGAITSGPSNVCSGIALVPGTTEVVVTTGRIVGFGFGVSGFITGPVTAVTRSQFSRLQIEGAFIEGIVLTGDDNAIENNVITGAGFGIDVFGDRNLVRRNEIDSGHFGFSVGGFGNTVSRNLAVRNRSAGFHIFGEQATVDHNRSEDNGDTGFYIEQPNHTVTRNSARGNGAHGDFFGGDGFFLDSEGAVVDHNTSEDSGGRGFVIAQPNNAVTLNIARGNRLEGFYIPGEAAMDRNLSEDNGGTGFFLEQANRAVTGNIARGNQGQGFVIFNGSGAVDRNRAEDNGLEGFIIDNANAPVTLNIARGNQGHGFSVGATENHFERNRSDDNRGGFGIFDPTIGNGTAGTSNTYVKNQCAGNEFGDSSPPSLCN